MIKRKLTIVLVVDIVLYLLFAVSCFSQEEFFAQEYYSPSTLTKVNWGLTTVSVQKFYYYSNGTVVPVSATTISPNYPFIIGVIFMVTNMLVIANIVNNLGKANKKTQKEKLNQPD